MLVNIPYMEHMGYRNHQTIPQTKSPKNCDPRLPPLGPRRGVLGAVPGRLRAAGGEVLGPWGDPRAKQKDEKTLKTWWTHGDFTMDRGFLLDFWWFFHGFLIEKWGFWWWFVDLHGFILDRYGQFRILSWSIHDLWWFLARDVWWLTKIEDGMRQNSPFISSFYQ